MPKFHRIFLLCTLVLALVSCAAPVTDVPVSISVTQTSAPVLVLPEVQIARYPAADDYTGIHQYTKLPTYNPNSDNPFQIDLRSSNLKKLNLTDSQESLFHALFDSQTQWPVAEQLPSDFNWQTIMEMGKDPGLGVRALHDQGVTGKGVNIAIIDQPLIIDHIEYRDRIKLYEEINISSDTPSQMHGPAVASIAVGKTVGVAPDTNLYYIATWLFDPEAGNQSFTYKYYAQAIRRLVEFNKGLPEDQKIRAVSMSIGMVSTEPTYDEFTAAIEEAKAAGIFVISVDLQETYSGWNILGMGRDSVADPNDFQSYGPPDWWQQRFYEQGLPADTLLIPMDSRTTASPTGKEDYVFYRHGGMSWTAPYLAGMYALAVQVKPAITPEQFWETALQTGKTIQIQHAGKEYDLGVILDPQALIDAIRNK